MWGKREIRTEIRIHADASQAWRQLTDFENYARWNPFIRRIEGELRPGARLRVQIEPETGICLNYHPEVIRCEPERELRWRSRLLVPGLLDREHSFVFEQLDCGWVKFVHRDRFSGLLPMLLGEWLEGQIRPGFERMNRALKSEPNRWRTWRSARLTGPTRWRASPDPQGALTRPSFKDSQLSGATRVAAGVAHAPLVATQILPYRIPTRNGDAEAVAGVKRRYTPWARLPAGGRRSRPAGRPECSAARKR